MYVKLALFALLVVAAAGIANPATCAKDAYLESCVICGFDENGKMDKDCYERYIEQGKACTFATDPVAAAKYSEGKCQPVATCVDRLEECKRTFESGNDRNDCASSTIAQCYATADQCFVQASDQCHDITSADVANLICPGGPMLIGLALLGSAFLSRKTPTA